VTRFLLDTNILSDLFRHPHGKVAARIEALGEHSICTSIIVAAELRFGAVRKGSARLTGQIEDLLSLITVEPLEAPVDIAYADLRTALEAAGTPIGANDTLIAAHAIAIDCTLVTDNEREFGRIGDLRIENWLR
jgi:tRNA(fMet)-specific endonuclease VapC